MITRLSDDASILVTGGTGLLGKAVCAILDKNHMPYVTATHQRNNLDTNFTHFDLESGEGIENAIVGKEIIFHLASDKKHPKNDVTGTIKMLDEIKRQGKNPHLIYISIVGVDRLPMTYFREKYQTEEAIKNSGLPYTILRATQFHEYLSDVIRMFLKIPVIAFIPKNMPVQSIDVNVVADQLVQMSLHPPLLNITNLGGNDIFSFGQAVSTWLHFQNKSKMLVNLPLWGRWGENLNAGALTTANRSIQGIDWEQWLAKLNPVY